jgi:lipopolysaccharide export system permease protein
MATTYKNNAITNKINATLGDFVKILQRYISRTLFHTILLVILLFIGIDIFILLAGQLHSYGSGAYSIMQAIIYVLLSLPEQIYQLFPMAAFIGVLMGMGLLDSHSEILVMRAAGVSPKQILLMVLKTGFILMLIATIIGELIGPQSQHLARLHSVMTADNGQAINTSKGLWIKEGPNFIHIRTIFSDKNIAQISRFEFDPQGRLQSATYADQGYFYDKLWHLVNVEQTIINDTGTGVVSSHINKLTWHLALNPHLLQISQIQPDEMTLQQLKDYIKFRDANGLLGDSYRIAFWHRVLQPIATLVMIFLAVPFIFGPLRSATKGLRALAGVIVGFFYYTLDQMFAPMSEVWQFPPLVAVLLPTLLFLFIGIYLMWKVK